MSSTNLKSYYLESSNQNKIRNYVMTELSRKFNIQPMIGQLNERFNRITEVISNNVASDNKLNLLQNLERINKITVEQLLNAFSQILVPYEKIQAPVIENKSTEPKNEDVNDLYSKLMNERDYIDNPPTSVSTPISQINKNSSRPTQFTLPTIPEDKSEPSIRNNSFVERIELLKKRISSTGGKKVKGRKTKKVLRKKCRRTRKNKRGGRGKKEEAKEEEKARAEAELIEGKIKILNNSREKKNEDALKRELDEKNRIELNKIVESNPNLSLEEINENLKEKINDWYK